MKLHKKDVFTELLWQNKWLLAAGIVFAYIQTQVLVTGNERLSGEIDRMLGGNAGNGLDAGFFLWLGMLVVLGFVAAYLKIR